MFCPECGSMLLPKKVDKKTVNSCSCGYTDENGTVSLKDKGKDDGRAEMQVVDPEDFENLPTMDMDCPQCGHTKAYYWLIQTRAGDEPETKFLKCEKCKHTWRDYS